MSAKGKRYLRYETRAVAYKQIPESAKYRKLVFAGSADQLLIGKSICYNDSLVMVTNVNSSRESYPSRGNALRFPMTSIFRCVCA